MAEELGFWPSQDPCPQSSCYDKQSIPDFCSLDSLWMLQAQHLKKLGVLLDVFNKANVYTKQKSSNSQSKYTGYTDQQYKLTQKNQC